MPFRSWMVMENINMTQKEEQLHKALKDAITNYRAFVVKNQLRNDVAMVSDIQFDENGVTYSNTDISSLEKCTGGTFTGMLKLHFKSDVDNKYDSILYHIVNGNYTVKKYENEAFNILINNIVCA